MSGRASSGAVGLVVAVLATLVPAAGVGASTVTRVAVSPRSIGPHTTVVLRFRVPRATGRRRHDSIAVGNASGGGCADARRVAFSATDPSRELRVALRPPEGGRWCAGVYRGEVIEQPTSGCEPGVHRFCPLYVIEPRTLARFRFRVTAR